jgi:hypothetical protein
MKILITFTLLLNTITSEAANINVEETIRFINESNSGKEFKLLLKDGYYINCTFPNDADSNEIYSVEKVRLSIFNKQNQCIIEKIDQTKYKERMKLVEKALNKVKSTELQEEVRKERERRNKK